MYIVSVDFLEQFRFTAKLRGSTDISHILPVPTHAQPHPLRHREQICWEWEGWRACQDGLQGNLCAHQMPWDWAMKGDDYQEEHSSAFKP